MLAFLVLSSFSVQGENCEFFECRDSSRVIPASFINDDFCDCPDGSDESSTSACLVGSFQCPEKIIHSSFVHDTICGKF
jgi:protein kinase C substrate 80K-H